MQYSGSWKRIFTLSFSFIFCCFSLYAQQLLNKQVSLQVQNEPLQKVLEQIGAQNGFYFSYNSNIIPGDSLISLSLKNKTVKQTLEAIFHGTMQYKEMEGFIILQRAAPQQSWYISGYILDGLSGERLNNVSIYEPEHLAGTTTDDKGYFRLQLKEKNKYPPVIAISVSRISYADTSFRVNAGYNQEVDIFISPSDRSLDAFTVSSGVQRTGLGKLLISARLKKQTANLRNFLATKPVQFSLTPGLGTHGQLGAQVVNKFSVNLLGGYTAGVNGFELGGLFNITEDNVRNVQVGGLFNIVGGYVNGLQVGGLHNKVLDSLKGMQVAGLVNIVKGSVTGFQVSGLVGNICTLDGMMVSGIVSKVKRNMKGLQISGITSITRHTVTGTQIAGILNYAGNLKGWQIGFINYADTASGYSIGLINLNKRGYHKFSISAGDMLDITLAYKGGNKNFYTILQAGANLVRKTAYGIGYGLGNEVTLSKRLSLTNELVTTTYYNGSWNNVPIISSLRTSLNFPLSEKIAMYAGPLLSVGERMPAPKEGYADVVPAHTLFNVGKTYKGWIGWQVGVSL